MEELLALEETRLQEQHKDLLAVLGAIAADEAKENPNVIGALQGAYIKDLALLIALLPRNDKSLF
jgi:hypothetical protein